MAFYLIGTSALPANQSVWVNTSPDSHDRRHWGDTDILPAFSGNVGAGVAPSTVQGNAALVYPFGYIYDIVATVTASGTGGNHLVDVWNVATGGSPGFFQTFNNGNPVASGNNSLLQSPIVIPSSVSALTAFSARQQGINVFPKIYEPNIDETFWKQNIGVNNPAIFKFGQPFSVRVTTPASTGSLSNLSVSVIMVLSDRPGFI